MESREIKVKEAKQLFLAQRWEEALSLYSQLFDADNENFHYCAALGEIHVALGQSEKGVAFFQKAIAVLESAQTKQSPQKNELLGTLYLLCGINLQKLRQRDNAIQALQKAAQVRENWADPYLVLGNLYFESAEYEQSLQMFQKAVQFSPNDGSAWLTAAHIAHIIKKYETAISASQQVLSQEPQSEQALFILADSLHATGHPQAAIEHFESLIARNEKNVQALYGYGQSLLAAGDLHRGWLGYEARRLCETGTWNTHFLPDWNGERAKDDSILAYGEGGICSEILFASCLPDLAEQVGHCYVECQPMLYSLFVRSFPNMTIVRAGEQPIVPDKFPGIYWDKQVAFGSLPRFFRTDLKQFPKTHASYLVADTLKTARWRKRYAEHRGRKIGILWEGAWSHEPAEQRRIPTETLQALFRCSRSSDEICWINLQHGSHRKDWQSLCNIKLSPMETYSEMFGADIDETAAAFASLDLVITPSGFQAHLASALGIPCWLILPQACDWRWHLSQEHSPWYPSAKLFRPQQNESSVQFTERIVSSFQEYLRLGGQTSKEWRRKAG